MAQDLPRSKDTHTHTHKQIHKQTNTRKQIHTSKSDRVRDISREIKIGWEIIYTERFHNKVVACVFK